MALNKKLILVTLAPCCSPSLIAIKGSKPHSHYKILANYNGQAELLLSLQITPDYFPYQFKQRSLYDYLTNIGKYLVINEKTSEKKKELKHKLQTRIDQLISKVSTFGPSLWNEDLYSGGLVNRNVQYWNTKSADYLFLEQFIIDDSSDPLFLIQRLPKHSHLAITNFRAARDPYSLFGEDVYKYFRDHSKTNQNSQTQNNLAKKLHAYYKNYSRISPNNLFRSAKYIYFWNDFCHHLQEQAKVKKEDLENLFRLPKKDEQLFAPHGKKDVDQRIAKEFFEEVFAEEELAVFKNGETTSEDFVMNYLKENGTQASIVATATSSNNNDSICSSELQSSLPVKVHHPALEHQTMRGSSPVSEGTQKDLLVYLSQMAIALNKITKTPHFASVFGSDPRKEFITKAWDNAVSIAKNYRERLKKVREYLQHIGVVDQEFDPEKNPSSKEKSKTVAIISYPPSQLGAGDASIQTVSKYPFLYSELGLNEVIPKDFTKDSSSHSDLLGVDDNGWWWRLGDFNFSSKGLDNFSSTADSIILLATEDDWNILNSWDSPKLRSLRSLLKTNNGKEGQITMSNYHLWNEGLRSPIALNLLLDVLVDTLTKQFGNGTAKDYQKYQQALDWGDYWENKYFSELQK